MKIDRDHCTTAAVNLQIDILMLQKRYIEAILKLF